MTLDTEASAICMRLENHSRQLQGLRIDDYQSRSELSAQHVADLRRLEQIRRIIGDRCPRPAVEAEPRKRRKRRMSRKRPAVPPRVRSGRLTSDFGASAWRKLLRSHIGRHFERLAERGPMQLEPRSK